MGDIKATRVGRDLLMPRLDRRTSGGGKESAGDEEVFVGHIVSSVIRLAGRRALEGRSQVRAI